MAATITTLPASLVGCRVHMVGIKGTGMAALAEILAARGALLSGTDVAERFQTDELLERLGVRAAIGFAAEDLPANVDVLIHSAAYPASETPQIAAAVSREIPVLTYPEALGALSRAAASVAISGVHGKTSTAALCGLLVDGLDLPATVLSATGVSNFGGAATLIRGDRYFVAETCEYRRHFEAFQPRHVVVTNVELEHVDAYATVEELYAAFVALACAAPGDGSLIYCADDPGATEVARQVAERHSLLLRQVPYGMSASGALQVRDVHAAAGGTSFALAALGDRRLTVRVPGRHTVLNATAAVGVALALLGDERRSLDDHARDAIAGSLAAYRGGRRRTEVVGEAGGVLVIDDYGHHPTELRSTLAGLRAFYPGRRMVVDFMSHTYSRTTALLADFATAFEAADEVLIHRVYASAREDPGAAAAGVADPADAVGRQLFEAIGRHHSTVRYCATFEQAVTYLSSSLVGGDLLVTMGAGDNWKVGRSVLSVLADAQ